MPPVSKEDTTTPSILDASGQTISEISVPVGKSQTFAITGYSGHTFNVVTLNTEVVDVSVSGTTLTVKGLKEGTTYLGVQDEQNKLMAIAEVTVTAGGDTPGPGPGGDVTAYTACPDSNHPHWIDLGIGTLWRCCNEGASTPEEYGGYYTFDQAQAYNPPSSDQIEALVNNCSYTWTTQNGVKGGKFTGPNGGTIFLPAAGYVWDGKLDDVGTFGRYRSSTSRGENGAYYLNFNAGYVGTSSVNDRYGGLSVRPVLKNSSLTLSVSTSSLSITKGETSTVDITSGSGEYGVTNLNGNIAKATLDGTTITVNAIAAGEAKIVVMDMQTKQEIIIKITVTAKSIGDTPGPGGDVTAYTACPDANHPHWIDLGTGILWRCCNVGASTPEEYGSYYTFDQAQAYNPPLLDQIEALVNYCSYTRTTQNGVNGWKFTSKVNGGTIFLPAAGFWDGELCYVGLHCLYWSSSPIDEDNAYGLDFGSGDVGPDYPIYHYGGRISRSLGRSVRPVLKNPSLTLSVSVSSLSMTEGEASIVYITSGSGEYGVTNLNSNIAKATLGGTRITVHAIAAGEAKIVVTDTQTKQEIIIKITVTAKSSGNTPAGLQAVDLGLPSGTLWANMNVGAETPEDYGLYFAWGETTGYTGGTSDVRKFDWTSYKWCNGSETTLTKYCTNSDYGTVDNKPVLEAEDDAAHVNWGGSWRMPTLADFQELRDNTTNEWTTQNGVNGRKFTSKTNGNSIFLPAAGDRCDSGLHDVGFDGRYWSSSLLENVPCYAHYLYFFSGYASWSNVLSRGYGHSVRPVLRNSSPILSVSTSSLSITEGETSTVDITSGSGEYGVTNMNSDIAKATLDGTRIIVNAIAAGEAEIAVTDIQTKQEIIVKITVTAKSSGNTPAGLQAVDLGLPSGTLWANMNVGAEKPEDYGLYFAWGETTGYTGDTSDGHTFDWASYKWCNGSEKTLTKYCTNSDYGTVDNKTVLDAEDDAAHVNWGDSWRMPTLADFQELIDNTAHGWVTQNGVNGYKFTSQTNGNSIFLPAAGVVWGDELNLVGSYGGYWSSTLGDENLAYYIYFYPSDASKGNYGRRNFGISVRPVR